MQTMGDAPVEEWTKGGTPSGGSITRGDPSEEDFLDKLPISINWAKASVGVELSAGSSGNPNVELFNKGNWTGGKNPSRRANGNFEDTAVYSD